MSGLDEPRAGFAPPGPRRWTLDTIHFPRPVTRFVAELFPPPARLGFQEASARYGLLMDHIEWAFVHRWAYLCPRPAVALPAGIDRQGWRRLASSDAELASRLAASRQVFEQRRWGEEVDRWDRRTKPRMLRMHRRLCSVAVADAGPAVLVSHLADCREHLEQAILEHHRLNVAPVIPAGDLLAQVREWTGRPLSELVGLLASPRPSAMAAGGELQRLAAALDRDGSAAAMVASAQTPASILAGLSQWPGEVGSAAAEYLGLAGCCSTGGGFEIGEPCLDELPRVLLSTIEEALGDRSPGNLREVRAEIREAVPRTHRRAFDALLAEALRAHRLRDERAVYCDVWAYGLCRRVILAAGRMLERRGAVAEAEHLLEAGFTEIRELLEGASGPSGAELVRRAQYRRAAPATAPPPGLGGPAPSPVPLEWLEDGPRRTERAFRTYLAAMSEEAPGSEPGALKGVAGSPGVYRGRARVVLGGDDLARIEAGDVLVAPATTPALGPVLPLLGAIVTDHGGLLSHAAIVARDLGIPAVVGTGDASSRIADGVEIVVDGSAGQVALPPPHSGPNRST